MYTCLKFPKVPFPGITILSVEDRWQQRREESLFESFKKKYKLLKGLVIINSYTKYKHKITVQALMELSGLKIWRNNLTDEWKSRVYVGFIWILANVAGLVVSRKFFYWGHDNKLKVALFCCLKKERNEKKIKLSRTRFIRKLISQVENDIRRLKNQDKWFFLFFFYFKIKWEWSLNREKNAKFWKMLNKRNKCGKCWIFSDISWVACSQLYAQNWKSCPGSPPLECWVLEL